jgi:pimeloyl-ACP methyl ester carboxylesterase
MSAIILQDEIVHYEVLGRGKPIIFLHGWVGSWRYWIPAMQAASVGFRAYALDLWGFGDTAKNTQFYSLEGQINLLDEFLAEMGIGKVALIGHGLGGLITLLYAARHPRFVDRALTVASPNGHDRINQRLLSASPTELADWLLSRAPEAEPARLEAPKADPRAIQVSLVDFSTIDIPYIYAQLIPPCLMVYGEQDPVIGSPPPEYLDHLPYHLHQVVFDNSGHFPMLDESSKFNRLLTEFLSLTSGETPRYLQVKEEWKRRVR